MTFLWVIDAKFIGLMCNGDTGNLPLLLFNKLGGMISTFSILLQAIWMMPKENKLIKIIDPKKISAKMQSGRIMANQR